MLTPANEMKRLISILMLTRDTRKIPGKKPSPPLQESKLSTTFRLLVRICRRLLGHLTIVGSYDNCPAILLGSKLSKWSIFAIAEKEMSYVNPVLIYLQKFQRSDWLRARQLILNRVQKSEISADS